MPSNTREQNNSRERSGRFGEAFNQLKSRIGEVFRSAGRLNAGEWVRNQADRVRSGWNGLVDRLRGRNPQEREAAASERELDKRVNQSLEQLQKEVNAFLQVAKRSEEYILQNPRQYAAELQAALDGGLMTMLRRIEADTVVGPRVAAKMSETFTQGMNDIKDLIQDLELTLPEDLTDNSAAQDVLRNRDAALAELQHVQAPEQGRFAELRARGNDALHTMNTQIRDVVARTGRVDLPSLYNNNRELTEAVVAAGVTVAGKAVSGATGVGAALFINAPVMGALEWRQNARHDAQAGGATEGFRTSFQRLAGQNAEQDVSAPQQTQEDARWNTRLSEAARMGMKFARETFMLPDKLMLLLMSQPHKHASRLVETMKEMTGGQATPEAFNRWAADRRAELARDPDGAEASLESFMNMMADFLHLELYGKDVPKKMIESAAETRVGRFFGLSGKDGVNDIDRTVINPRSLATLEESIREFLNSSEMRRYLNDAQPGKNDENVHFLRELQAMLNDEDTRKKTMDKMAQRERKKIFAARLLGMLFRAGVVAAAGETILRASDEKGFADTSNGKPLPETKPAFATVGPDGKPLPPTMKIGETTDVTLPKAETPSTLTVAPTQDVTRPGFDVDAQREIAAAKELNAKTWVSSNAEDMNPGGMPVDQLTKDGTSAIGEFSGGIWEATQASYDDFVEKFLASGGKLTDIPENLSNAAVNAAKNLIQYGGSNEIMTGDQLRYLEQIVQYSMDNRNSTDPVVQAVFALGPEGGRNIPELTQAAQVLGEALKDGLKNDWEKVGQ